MYSHNKTKDSQNRYAEWREATAKIPEYDLILEQVNPTFGDRSQVNACDWRPGRNIRDNGMGMLCLSVCTHIMGLTGIFENWAVFFFFA